MAKTASKLRGRIFLFIYGSPDPPYLNDIITGIISGIVAIATVVWSYIETAYTYVATTNIWIAVTQIWEFLDTFVGLVKGWISGIWGFIKPFYDWVLNQLWPLVKWCIDNIYKIYDWVRSALDTVTKWIDTVYKALFGQIIDIWNKLDDVWGKLTRMISVLDKETARKMQELRDEFRAQTIGRIEQLRGTLVEYVDKARQYLESTIGDTLRIVKDFEKRVDVTFAKFDEMMGGFFEEKAVLKDEAVKLTTRRYGMTMWRELFPKTVVSESPEDMERMKRVPYKNWLTEAIENIEAWDKGKWADVATNLDYHIACIGAEIEPEMDMVLEPDLMAAEENEEKQYLEEEAKSDEPYEEEEVYS